MKFLRDLSRRGALRPAFMFATVAMAACATHAADTKLDLATEIRSADYAAGLRSLRDCKQDALSIAYSFGDIELRATPEVSGCRLRVVINTELGEAGQSQTFACAMNTLDAIDWLHRNGRLREAPPLQEVLGHSACMAME